MSMTYIRFNKRREDFPDLRQYNDYLEEVEDLSEQSFILRPTICFTTTQLSI